MVFILTPHLVLAISSFHSLIKALSMLLICSSIQPPAKMSWLVYLLASYWILLEVSCQGCEQNDVRLVDGGSALEGTVTICRNGRWGTVCDDEWGDRDASVVCRQLGFSPQGAEHTREAFFGRGTGPIFLDNVQCGGSELTLADCPSRENNCDHSQDAGVRCQGITFIEVSLTGESAVLVSWKSRPEASQYRLNISHAVNQFGRLIVHSILVERVTWFLYEELLLNESYTICVSSVLGTHEASVCRNIQTSSPASPPSTISRSTQAAFQNISTSAPAFHSKGTAMVGILGFVVALLLLLLIVTGIGLAFISHMWSTSLKDKKHFLNTIQDIQTRNGGTDYDSVRQGASSTAGRSGITTTESPIFLHKTISHSPCECKASNHLPVRQGASSRDGRGVTPTFTPTTHNCECRAPNQLPVRGARSRDGSGITPNVTPSFPDCECRTYNQLYEVLEEVVKPSDQSFTDHKTETAFEESYKTLEPPPDFTHSRNFALLSPTGPSQQQSWEQEKNYSHLQRESEVKLTFPS